YLGLLLHDVGKPTGHGHHAEVSAEMALRAAKRLKLDASATETLRTIIAQHLLMSQVSQRRDLEDPSVIRAFGKEVQNVENLTLLTLLTFADTLATSEKLWNGFKDALIRSLFGKTLALLSGGTEFVRATEKQREMAMHEVRRVLHGQAYEEELQAHFATLPSRYFQTQTARDVTGDVLLAHRFLRLQISDVDHPLAPVVNWHNDPDLSCNTVKVCTWDRSGLFNKIAGSLSASGLNILSAQIFTRADGIVLDTFYVTDAVTGNLAERSQRDTFENLLNKILTGAEVDVRALISRQKITRPPYQAYSGERIPTVIHFDNEASETRSLIEIETEDRLGLLYVISLELAKLDIDISTAKIVTEKGAAIDSFYVSEAGAGKIASPERQKEIEHRLRAAIKTLEGD
ncbi:MAG TPA: HD domain-containing protein, partial [Verrucomicrobiae bacterium]|nr:HD domain-containing protein [Verrucomicrobiae bacterium]